MRYMILIHENEAAAPHDDAEMAKWFEYTERLRKSGAFVAGEAVQPTATAKTVRKQDGRVQVTDGPFAKTAEQFGGFYIVQCKDLDEAIKWAADIPSAGRGPVEVRPIIEMPPG